MRAIGFSPIWRPAARPCTRISTRGDWCSRSMPLLRPPNSTIGKQPWARPPARARNRCGWSVTCRVVWARGWRRTSWSSTSWATTACSSASASRPCASTTCVGLPALACSMCSSVIKTSSGVPMPQNRPLVPQSRPSTPPGIVPPSFLTTHSVEVGGEHEALFLNAARIPRVAGGAVIVIGLGALAGWQLDVAWLKSFAPGQATMSPAAALGLVLLGIALWLSSQRGVSRAVAWVADACAAAVAFLIAAAGVLWCRPDRGFAALVASPTPGGVLTRRLLPAIIVVPLLLGWLGLAGQGSGLYDTAGGTALFASGIVAVLAALAWWGVRSVDRADAKRPAAEQMLRVTQAPLQQVLASSTAVIYRDRVRGTSVCPSRLS